jgi:hypothetical protein
MRLQGASSQSASMIIVQDSAGVAKMTVSPDGTVNGANVGTVPGGTITYVPTIVLNAAEAIPSGTLAGTVILRRP